MQYDVPYIPYSATAGDLMDENTEELEFSILDFPKLTRRKNQLFATAEKIRFSWMERQQTSNENIQKGMPTVRH